EVSEKVTREEGITVRPDPGLSEFELFVSRMAATGKSVRDKDGEPVIQVRRYGIDLALGIVAEEADEGPTLVPEDYVLGAGDEILLNLWGGVEANLRLRVDRTGVVAIPRVGSVALNGVRFSDLKKVLAQRVATQFRNFDLSVALGEVKAMRVYVTGFVQKPGAYSVSGLSTMLQAVMQAGGPTAVGSYRNIQLRRANAVISTLDLYDFMLKGDRSADRLLRSGDVIHVGAIGAQVGVVGSVNNPAVFEVHGSETVADALRMAGGVSAVANRVHAALHSFDDKSGQALRDLSLKSDSGLPLRHGDVLRVFSAADISRPNQGASKKVRVEGEVQRPGDYVLAAGSTLRDALKAAGGPTSGAFLFGAEFNRESVRVAQQESYERSLRDLETEFKKAALGPKSDEAPEDTVMRSVGQGKLIERLRAVRPSGRVVLQSAGASNELPDMLVEDGDRLYIPAQPTTVSVFGSVFNAGSYMYTAGRDLDEYLRQSGGPTKTADKGSVFVIRANGSVVSSLARKSGWFTDGSIDGVQAMAGDTIFVPENIYKTSSMRETKDWAQILYQFALGVATIKSIN
ncbi:MAG: SLBB domain-containing protein, partial [Burkholderiaceae bacterium]|nr:SLBB domain-containing protein [Burkholderiaceae bacterium]